jgi:lipopolysaccharide heptosyltransferase II
LEVDDVLVFDAPWMKATSDHPADVGRMADSLRAQRFDAAVVFTVYSQSPLPAALLCYQAGIPLRLAHCHENPYHLLTDWVPDPEPATLIRHEVQRQLDLVATVGCETADTRLSLAVGDVAMMKAEQALRDAIEPSRPWLAMHVGASAPSRRYPVESFAEVARTLSCEDGYHIVFTGDSSERPLVDEVRERMQAPSSSVAGLLDLEQLAGLIAQAPLLISNNSGPVHIAAAVGTPVVDLYALTNPQHQPWGVPNRVLSHDVPCKYCYKSICPQGHHDCLRLVAPEAVVSSARELLSSSAPPRAPAAGPNDR